MNNEIVASEKWQSLISESLKSGSVSDKIVALDFLGHQNSLCESICEKFIPMIQNDILHPDTQVRYFARKALNHILDCFPELDSKKDKNEDFSLDLKSGEPLTPQKILLHKLRLGSRYVVFEALERLTENGDPAMVEPLLEYLKEEKDEYKISYLFKVLSRIDDPRIPETLTKYLDHEDPRIVANAIESLAAYDVPENVERLKELANSKDNRIRANAVKGLHKYLPELAEKHIAEMINSDNIALQASGVFLLKTLRPANLQQLLEKAHNSRFATVRIKALDVPPPSKDELELIESNKRIDIEKPDPERDFFFMEIFLGIGLLTLIITNARNKMLMTMAFIILALAIMLMHEKTRTSIQKMALSMGFISSLAWGNTRLMVLPALMGLWLTWTGNRINKDGRFEKATIESIFAWFFAMGSIIITQLIQNEMAIVLNLASSLAVAAKNVPLPIADIVARQNRFEIVSYVMVSLLTIFIFKFNSWFPPKSPKQRPLKRLIIATVICLGLILLVNLSHVLGIQVQIKVNGLKSTLGVVKELLPQM
ncbi:MAG: hypothetical protein Kow0029_05350 [Candidatus Rifleibacteriota bacterium]